MANNRRWTAAEIQQMNDLFAAGMKDRAVARRLCRTAQAVTSKRWEVRARRKNGLPDRKPALVAKKPRPAKAEKPQKLRVLAPPPVDVVAPDPPYLRPSSTARLAMDAELRGRIEILGATGGLLGDPLPGRSALDQRKQQEAGR